MKTECAGRAHARIGGPMSWAPQVSTVSDPVGVYTGNGLRFATKQEALDWARLLSHRWVLVAAWRAVESEEPVNSALDGSGSLVTRGGS